tara:strand:+ start:72357 stop:72962 length:606 start_codon:yes stop_codon:yes gene_type:complete
MFKLFGLFVSVTLVSASAYAGFFDKIEKSIEGAIQEEVQKGADGLLEPLADSDVTEGELWDEIRFEWGQNIVPDNVSFIEHDVTCDGNKDFVAGHLNQDNPDGPFYDILIVTKDGKNVISEIKSLAFDGTQEGLCEPYDKPDVSIEIEHWDESRLDAELGSWEGVCTEALRVDDGMCDAIRYFWLTGDKDANASQMMSYRN